MTYPVFIMAGLELRNDKNLTQNLTQKQQRTHDLT